MINFPNGLDTLTNPTSTDKLDSVTVPHHEQHSNANDAIEALQVKVGINGSSDTNSLDYKISYRIPKVTSTDDAIVAFSGTAGEVKNTNLTKTDLDTYIGKSGSHRVATDLKTIGMNTINWAGGVVPKATIGTNSVTGLIGAVAGTWNKIGDSTTLLTTSKTTIVGAINELFNGKVSKVVSTDNAIVRFNGTTGEVQDSGVIVSDSGNVEIKRGLDTIPVVGKKSDSQLNLEIGGNGLVDTKSTITMGWSVNRNYAPVAISAINRSSNASTYSDLAFFTRANTNDEAPVERMRLLYNGNLLVGTTTDNGADKLQVNGSISSGAVQIYTTGDLNNLKYTTQTVGVYPNMSNLPIYDHGYLEVFIYSQNTWVMQRFTCLGATNIAYAGRTFVRCYANGIWTAWVEK